MPESTKQSSLTEAKRGDRAILLNTYIFKFVYVVTKLLALASAFL